MIEEEATLTEFYLHPGEMYISRDPAIMRTVLGSCVGITFWSPRLKIGALCHAVLPRIPPELIAGRSSAESYRYVDFCISDVTRQMESMGARRGELEIKLFGGADVLPVMARSSAHTTVGRQNIEVALEMLRKENLDVTVNDLGGTQGCTLQFNTATGEVLLRRLKQPSLEAEAAGSGI